MAVYKRGGRWWLEFSFQGQRVRESTSSTSKTLASEAEGQRRRELETGINRLQKRERMPLFKLAAEQRLSTKRNLSRFTGLHHRQYVASLGGKFAERLVCDIRLEDIARLRERRQATGSSARAANTQLQALRHILRHFGLATLQGRVRFRRDPKDTGCAVRREDGARLLQAAGQSRSPALLPWLTLALDTGCAQTRCASSGTKTLSLRGAKVRSRKVG